MTAKVSLSFLNIAPLDPLRGQDRPNIRAGRTISVVDSYSKSFLLLPRASEILPRECGIHRACERC